MKGGLTRFEAGEGLAGQAAVERTPILITDVPPATSRSDRDWATPRR